MSGDDVRVSATHLADLAARHARTASDAMATARSAEEIGEAVRNTHGDIAASTAGALGTVLDSRRRAGTKLVDASAALSDTLADALARYDRTDEAAASVLNAQMQADRT
ncbi:type VII secretion target [Mycobacterium sp. 852002-51961_SCH5331710]|uniref:type VII secretion target n=1 Tax=Mycobacterium sp. 852002-51961_SCH5331710 TaxID=1834105 RepID=UPI000801D0F8|nr:type VII secretion target [Mycobacterium sp. 852002-51961_SCH5331710]OBB48473.1 hypothetical protein A5752_01115 [Mycobacterium sp. 852002-51961_SCH5331710]